MGREKRGKKARNNIKEIKKMKEKTINTKGHTKAI